jgi:hypothetical protein
MSDSNATPARPVSLFTLVFLFAVFAAFLLVIRWFYQPAPAWAVNSTPDNLSKDLEWRANPASRQKVLSDLHEAESKKAASYGWVDQKAGTVQLPIERAMELTARDLAAKQQVRSIRDLPSDRSKL